MTCGREIVAQMKWWRNTSKCKAGCWGCVTFTSGCLWMSKWYATFLTQQAECLVQLNVSWMWKPVMLSIASWLSFIWHLPLMVPFLFVCLCLFLWWCKEGKEQEQKYPQVFDGFSTQLRTTIQNHLFFIVYKHYASVKNAHFCFSKCFNSSQGN